MLFIQKEINCLIKLNTEMMTASVMKIQALEDENSEDEEMVENGNIASDLIHLAKNGTKYKYRKVPKVIRYVRHNQTKDPENYYREQLMLFMP